MHSVWTVDDRAGFDSDRAHRHGAGGESRTARHSTGLHLVRPASPVVQDDPGMAAPMLGAGASMAGLVVTGRSPRTDRDSGVDRRALALWPRLDRRALTRCRGDSVRIARHVARRTSLPFDVILGMLEGV